MDSDGTGKNNNNKKNLGGNINDSTRENLVSHRRARYARA